MTWGPHCTGGFSHFNRLFATNGHMVQNSPAGGQAYYYFRTGTIITKGMTG